MCGLGKGIDATGCMEEEKRGQGAEGAATRFRALSDQARATRDVCDRDRLRRGRHQRAAFIERAEASSGKG